MSIEVTLNGYQNVVAGGERFIRLALLTNENKNHWNLTRGGTATAIATAFATGGGIGTATAVATGGGSGGGGGGGE